MPIRRSIAGLLLLVSLSAIAGPKEENSSLLALLKRCKFSVRTGFIVLTVGTVILGGYLNSGSEIAFSLTDEDKKLLKARVGTHEERQVVGREMTKLSMRAMRSAMSHPGTVEVSAHLMPEGYEGSALLAMLAVDIGGNGTYIENAAVTSAIKAEAKKVGSPLAGDFPVNPFSEETVPALWAGLMDLSPDQREQILEASILAKSNDAENKGQISPNATVRDLLFSATLFPIKELFDERKNGIQIRREYLTPEFLKEKK